MAIGSTGFIRPYLLAIKVGELFGVGLHHPIDSGLHCSSPFELSKVNIKCRNESSVPAFKAHRQWEDRGGDDGQGDALFALREEDGADT